MQGISIKSGKEHSGQIKTVHAMAWAYRRG